MLGRYRNQVRKPSSEAVAALMKAQQGFGEEALALPPKRCGLVRIVFPCANCQLYAALEGVWFGASNLPRLSGNHPRRCPN